MKKTTQTTMETVCLPLQPIDLPLTLIFIPGGTFQMGSPGEEGDFDNEKPQHTVTVTDFFMGRYPVTQAQWAAVASLPKSKIPLEIDPSRFKGNNHPVEQVSWEEAVEFCERLSSQSQRNYRLPSEAEWEYACRAGTTTRFHFGDTISGNANYNSNCGTGTVPVDRFGCNRFGLYDLHGNVMEWCLDCWHRNYIGAPENNPWLEGNTMKVLRGGSWVDSSRFCRSAYRYSRPMDLRSEHCGFRITMQF